MKKFFLIVIICFQLLAAKSQIPPEVAISIGIGGGGAVNSEKYGSGALHLNVQGSFNSAFGSASLYNTTSSFNTGFGANVLQLNITGSGLTALGSGVLRNNVASNNTGVGVFSLYYNTYGTHNTASGAYSMYSNTLGWYNTALGVYSLFSNTTGFYNTAVGYYSLYANTTGSSNTASGLLSLYQNTTGSTNTATGVYSLYQNTTGSNNTGNGAYALYANTTGTQNTAFGTSPLEQNSAGNFNTAIGLGSLKNSKADNNTAVGMNSLKDLTTGANNTVVGYNTGGGIVSGSNNTIIGANVTNLPEGLANSIILADGNGTQRLFIDNGGKVRIGDANLTTPGLYKLYVKDGILTEKAVIAMANSTQWADYVFAPGYRLMPLNEVSHFIEENRHLPNIPTASDVVKNGIDVGAMNARLLEKIEELTLYLIEQHNKYEALQKEVNELKVKAQIKK